MHFVQRTHKIKGKYNPYKTVFTTNDLSQEGMKQIDFYREPPVMISSCIKLKEHVWLSTGIAIFQGTQLRL